MGEAKRKQEKLTPLEKEGVKLTHKLADEGKLIESGFVLFLMGHKMLPEQVPTELLKFARDAYMAGSEHMWSSIMATLDDGVEPTERDMRRMSAIDAEISAWRKEKMEAFAKAAPTKGSA